MRKHLSYSNIVASLALFVALGGSSYAAIKVGSKQIVNNSIRSKDIRNNQVSTRDVKNGSLLSRDFKAGQLPAGATGPQGPQGPQGLRGVQGTPGSPGISGLERVQATSPTNSTSARITSVNCPAGKRVVGSAASLQDPNTGEVGAELTDVVISAIIPNAALTMVAVRATEEEPTAANWSVTVYAICAHVS